MRGYPKINLHLNYPIFESIGTICPIVYIPALAGIVHHDDLLTTRHICISWTGFDG
jgi:hypothetical protein